MRHIYIKKNKFNCSCCGYRTLNEKYSYEICPICFWEDDHYQHCHPNSFCGANKISLKMSRNNYIRFGACERRFIKYVRKPNWIEQERRQK